MKGKQKDNQHMMITKNIESGSYRIVKAFFENKHPTEEEVNDFSDFLMDKEKMRENWNGVEKIFFELINHYEKG